MKYAIYIKATGQVMQIVSGPNRFVIPPLSDDQAFLEVAEWSGGYVEGGVVVSFPPQPSNRHVFDYSTKQWVDQRTLEDLQKEKWAEIKAKRDAEQLAGFVWDGSRFQSDLTSQSRIQSAAWAASVDQAFETDWTLADNSTRLLNATDMVAVGIALRSHIDAAHAKAKTLRSQIEAAATKEVVEALSW